MAWMRSCVILALCWSGHLLAAAGAKDRWTLLEVAPLRSVAGAPAVRCESAVGRQVGVGLAWERASLHGDREDFLDRREAIGIEGLWYPVLGRLNQKGWAPFASAGLVREEAWHGRERPRDAMTWARTTESERFDRWVDHNTYIEETVGFGTRVTRGLMTASFKLDRSEVLTRQRHVEMADVKSATGDPKSDGGRGRPAVLSRVSLYIGILLP